MIGLLTESIGNPTPMEVGVRAGSPDGAAPTCRSRSSRRSGTSASPSTTRSPRTGRCSTSRRATARSSSTTSTRWARTASTRGRKTPGRCIRAGCRRSRTRSRRRRRWTPAIRAWWPAASRATPCRSRNTRSSRRSPSGAIRAATSCPPNQPDFLTATKFVNALIKNGVTVHRATAAFSAGGKQYPAGSWVVKTAQAFRPHVLDMFEPQDHPNDFQFPGGPPIPPYDNAGWTLAYQMGVKFDRMLDGFDGPFEKVDRPAEAGGRQGHRSRGRRRLRRAAQPERRVHRRQPAAEGERGSVLRRRSQLSERRRHRRDLHHRQADHERGAHQGRGRSRLELHRGHAASLGRDAASSPSRASACGTCMAARCRQAGRAGCSSSSSSTSSACSRRRSMPATSRRSSTC